MTKNHTANSLDNTHGKKRNVNMKKSENILENIPFCDLFRRNNNNFLREENGLNLFTKEKKRKSL